MKVSRKRQIDVAACDLLRNIVCQNRALPACHAGQFIPTHMGMLRNHTGRHAIQPAKLDQPGSTER